MTVAWLSPQVDAMIVMTHTGSCCSTAISVSMEFHTGRSAGKKRNEVQRVFFTPNDLIPPGMMSMRTRQGTPRGPTL
nr:hypothetical protein pPsy0462b_00093 [Pseudomonas syringae]